MAYTTGTLNLISQTLEGSAGTKKWTYVTADSLATVIGASYITDATKKGLVKGDVVEVVNTTTPSLWRLEVQSISAGAATLGELAATMGAAAASTIGFYGTTPISQRSSANQAAVSTSAAVAISSGFGFATSAQANAVILGLSEVVATLTALGLWKGS